MSAAAFVGKHADSVSNPGPYIAVGTEQSGDERRHRRTRSRARSISRSSRNRAPAMGEVQPVPKHADVSLYDITSATDRGRRRSVSRRQSFVVASDDRSAIEDYIPSKRTYAEAFDEDDLQDGGVYFEGLPVERARHFAWLLLKRFAGTASVGFSAFTRIVMSIISLWATAESHSEAERPPSPKKLKASSSAEEPRIADLSVNDKSLYLDITPGSSANPLPLPISGSSTPYTGVSDMKPLLAKDQSYNDTGFDRLLLRSPVLSKQEQPTEKYEDVMQEKNIPEVPIKEALPETAVESPSNGVSNGFNAFGFLKSFFGPSETEPVDSKLQESELPGVEQDLKPQTTISDTVKQEPDRQAPSDANGASVFESGSPLANFKSRGASQKASQKDSLRDSQRDPRRDPFAAPKARIPSDKPKDLSSSRISSNSQKTFSLYEIRGSSFARKTSGSVLNEAPQYMSTMSYGTTFSLKPKSSSSSAVTTTKAASYQDRRRSSSRRKSQSGLQFKEALRSGHIKDTHRAALEPVSLFGGFPLAKEDELFYKEARERGKLREQRVISSFGRASFELPDSGVLAENARNYNEIHETRLKLQKEIDDFKKGRKKSVFEPLSATAMDTVQKYFAKPRSYDDQTVADAYKVRVTFRDLRTLQPGTWLNDTVIDFYLAHITHKARQTGLSQSFAFSTHFFTTLTSDKGYTGVARWAMRKKIDVTKMDYVFVPINQNNSHWCLAVINNADRCYEFYNSLSGEGSMALRYLEDYMINEADRIDKAKHNEHVELYTSYQHLSSVTCPRQQNGIDCGVFTCTNVDLLSRKIPLNYSQKDVSLMRLRMAYEIINYENVSKM